MECSTGSRESSRGSRQSSSGHRHPPWNDWPSKHGGGGTPLPAARRRRGLFVKLQPAFRRPSLASSPPPSRCKHPRATWRRRRRLRATGGAPLVLAAAGGFPRLRRRARCRGSRLAALGARVVRAAGREPRSHERMLRRRRPLPGAAGRRRGSLVRAVRGAGRCAASAPAAAAGAAAAAAALLAAGMSGGDLRRDAEAASADLDLAERLCGSDWGSTHLGTAGQAVTPG
jgi:hypothetical protein